MHMIEYLSKEVSHLITCIQNIYSSNSTPFSDKCVPAIGFARYKKPENMIEEINILKKIH